MQLVLLAGGLGTRISEETEVKPKPMIEIGGKPIIWHIMKIYSHHGINEFIICCGYKGYMIKEYFSNYFLHTSDVTFNLANNETQLHTGTAEPWKVTLIDTGEDTMTGGRLKKIKHYINGTFCMTYGDGVGDINISKVINSHITSKKLATVTAVKPSGRFGALKIKDDLVSNFMEKPDGDGSWINAGFFVLEPETLDLIKDAQTKWEEEPLESLSNKSQLNAYKHEGFWQPMDTLRDKKTLETMWNDNNAPWRVWR